ncbi:uncharacterized protein FOMMEDRAFT_17424 [Fomitiporia mediterranea MF3/22]|uniref:uncharacterized protein n=1 Tax=Fomitiporia mediterranea (strain MF3/22) TaxID=694068 RepID=UPI00044072A5|nr:uncharacterized protein FOMMEDRAFT_17424 [Fomitiporia mediterranea MF3/22]EJD06964.1 hypothetical protein FOMMEDRAFT_17424 [Fomitiporia mediterranea MF3/22]
MKSTSEYSPLAVSDETEESVFSVSLDDDQCNAQSSIEGATLGRLLGLTVVLSLVCSIVSLVFLCLNARTQWDLHHLLGGIVMHSGTPNERPDPGLLERPSVYNGLDKLPPDLQHSALRGTLDVFPPFFQPVDHVHRHYVFPSDGHARFTFNGRVSPGDHRILLTDHITMVAQFRVRDYGMERCRIVS